MLRVWESVRRGQRTARKQLVASASHAAFCLSFFLPAITTGAHHVNPRFDLVIIHGRIVDGTGSPWYSGDVGIRNGRIAAIGNLEREARAKTVDAQDRKSTRLNSSHSQISYAVFCLKKKKRARGHALRTAVDLLPLAVPVRLC